MCVHKYNGILLIHWKKEFKILPFGHNTDGPREYTKDVKQRQICTLISLICGT